METVNEFKISEFLKRNFTEDEFKKLLNSNSTIRKSLGWHIPPVGRPGISGNGPYVAKPFGDELPKVEDYVSPGVSGYELYELYAQKPFGDKLYNEILKVEDYVSLRNIYNISEDKNYWEYKSSIGCMGFTNKYVGDNLEDLVAIWFSESDFIPEKFSHPPVFSQNGERLYFNEKAELVSEEYPAWTELSNDFRETAHRYKDGEFDYRTIWKWFQEQHNKYKLEKLLD